MVGGGVGSFGIAELCARADVGVVVAEPIVPWLREISATRSGWPCTSR